MSLFFYKLGHQADLGIAEFLQLTNNATYKISYGWLVSEAQLDATLTGSLVYSGEILGETTPENYLEDLRELLPVSKKIGIALSSFDYASKAVLNLSKEIGCKKINVMNKLPNYGHWKSCKSWVIIFKFGNKNLVGVIQNYADQEFFAKLDTSLENDMVRGIINLKLARTLLNFTKNLDIWDPFAGQGRLMLAGYDLKNNFICSDLDETTIDQIDANDEIACRFFKTESKLRYNFAMDVSQLKGHKEYAIVTEGWLGQNFLKTPNMEQIAKQWKEVEALWLEFLAKASQNGTKEIVGCLPFYQIKSQKLIPEFLENLTEFYDFEELLPKQKYLLYSREKSMVGHLIIKLVLKS